MKLEDQYPSFRILKWDNSELCFTMSLSPLVSWKTPMPMVGTLFANLPFMAAFPFPVSLPTLRYCASQVRYFPILESLSQGWLIFVLDLVWEPILRQHFRVSL